MTSFILYFKISKYWFSRIGNTCLFFELFHFYSETREGAEKYVLEEPIGIYMDFFFFFFINCVIACVIENEYGQRQQTDQQLENKTTRERLNTQTRIWNMNEMLYSPLAWQQKMSFPMSFLSSHTENLVVERWQCRNWSKCSHRKKKKTPRIQTWINTNLVAKWL